MFATKDQLPLRYSREGYLETIPALVVEVLSENDRSRQLARRVQQYLRAGGRVVWLVDPQRRAVTIHRLGEPPALLGEEGTLTTEGIIPGLSYPVQRLFEGLE